MNEIRGRTYRNNEAVRVDGMRFIDCNFEAATMVYAGGAHPAFETCTFGDISWRFTEAALRTIQLLQIMHNEQPSGAFVADLFERGQILTA